MDEKLPCLHWWDQLNFPIFDENFRLFWLFVENIRYPNFNFWTKFVFFKHMVRINGWKLTFFAFMRSMSANFGFARINKAALKGNILIVRESVISGPFNGNIFISNPSSIRRAAITQTRLVSVALMPPKANLCFAVNWQFPILG